MPARKVASGKRRGSPLDARQRAGDRANHYPREDQAQKDRAAKREPPESRDLGRPIRKLTQLSGQRTASLETHRPGLDLEPRDRLPERDPLVVRHLHHPLGLDPLVVIPTKPRLELLPGRSQLVE